MPGFWKTIMFEDFDYLLDDWFNCGYCHVLALALHEITGFPMYLAVNEGQDLTFCHVLVQTPDGRFLDFNGLRYQEDILAGWRDQLGYGDDDIIFTAIDVGIVEHMMAKGWLTNVNLLRDKEITQEIEAIKAVSKFLATKLVQKLDLTNPVPFAT